MKVEVATGVMRPHAKEHQAGATRSRKRQGRALP